MSDGHILVHLSDTHLTTAGVRYNGVVDADAGLAAAVAEIRRGLDNGHRIDAVIASGDLTDSGDPVAYRRLRSELESLGPPVIWCTGNHDLRHTFQAELLDRTVDLGSPSMDRYLLPGGLRVLVLDSTVVGAGHGRLDRNVLDDLISELRTPAPAGTVVVLHHAPLLPPSPLLRYFALLPESRRALDATIAGTDVHLVLAGHHHLAQSGMLGAVPVLVAGSTAIRTDPWGPVGHERTTGSASLNLVQLHPLGPGDFTHTCSVIPLDGAPEIFDLDPEACAAITHRYPIDADGVDPVLPRAGVAPG